MGLNVDRLTYPSWHCPGEQTSSVAVVHVDSPGLQLGASAQSELTRV